MATKKAVKAVDTGTEAVPEKTLSSRLHHPYGYDGHHKASSNISISSNSILGQKHLTNIVQKALVDNGFSNVTMLTYGDFDHATGQPRVQEKEEPQSILDALTERNPSFFRAQVSISSNNYHNNDIPPDSEYPCAGAAIKSYETGGYSRNNIIAVDEAGGKEHVGSFTSLSDAERIASLLNKELA